LIREREAPSEGGRKWPASRWKKERIAKRGKGAWCTSSIQGGKKGESRRGKKGGRVPLEKGKGAFEWFGGPPGGTTEIPGEKGSL